MDDLSGLLFLLAVALLIPLGVGLISPRSVLFWIDEPSRWKVVLVFGSAIALCLLVANAN